MDDIAVVYWSDTGETRRMAQLVNKGIAEAGGQADWYTVDQFSSDIARFYRKIAFGCPQSIRTGKQKSRFARMYRAIRRTLHGKDVVFFGYGKKTEDHWLEKWSRDSQKAGAYLLAKPLMVQKANEAVAEKDCKELGKKLV